MRDEGGGKGRRREGSKERGGGRWRNGGNWRGGRVGRKNSRSVNEKFGTQVKYFDDLKSEGVQRGDLQIHNF
jgi:hypothetical protein